MSQDNLKKAISEIMFELDPIGINFEDNEDEYDSEAEQVLAIVYKVKSVDELEQKIVSLFKSMFSDDDIQENAVYAEIARRIWRLFYNPIQNR